MRALWALTMRVRPSASGMVGAYPNACQARAVSAAVCLTSPGWAGSRTVSTSRPTNVLTMRINSANEVRDPPPMLASNVGLVNDPYPTENDPVGLGWSKPD